MRCILAVAGEKLLPFPRGRAWRCRVNRTSEKMAAECLLHGLLQSIRRPNGFPDTAVVAHFSSRLGLVGSPSQAHLRGANALRHVEISDKVSAHIDARPYSSHSHISARLLFPALSPAEQGAPPPLPFRVLRRESNLQQLSKSGMTDKLIFSS